MSLSRESMLALQRHFLGALSAPARTWLEPMPSSSLAFAGNAIRPAGDRCMLDLGNVVTPGDERLLVRVFHRGTERLDLRLDGTPPWLTARWLDVAGDTVGLTGADAGATLEVRVSHDAEREFHGSLRFLAGSLVDELPVRLTTRRAHPIAQLDFNGSPSPRPFDFGIDDRPYALSIANATRVPLVVTFADLPEWLAFEVDGRSRNGPIAGTFFERTAPFAVMLRPRILGRHAGSLRLHTTDPRPQWRDVELRFTSSLVAVKPCVRAVPPPRTGVRAGQTCTTAARLENWGRSPARISARQTSQALEVRDRPLVPAAREGAPGTTMLPIRITPSQLAPGTHTLPLSLEIENGEPARVDVPVQIDVLAQRNGALRPETIAALLALLLLTILFVVGRGLQ